VKPTGGEGRVLGFDLRTEAEKIKTRIGYLSQSFTLYGDLSVDENIEFFAQIQGSGITRAAERVAGFHASRPFGAAWHRTFRAA